MPLLYGGFGFVTSLPFTKHLLLFVQIGFIGLVEEEWLVTLATVDREEVTYMDFVTEGTKLAKELREEVRGFLSSLEVTIFNVSCFSWC